MPKYLTAEQAAEELGLSLRTVRRMIEVGELPARKLLHSVRIKATDLDDVGRPIIQIHAPAPAPATTKRTRTRRTRRPTS
jgi:excisionase family DNA binding protein